MKFGERLKQARTNLGRTQETVANELHVSRQTISSWENERSYPDINSLIQLSNYYQLSLDTLLKEDNGMVEEMRRKEELAKINKIWGVSYVMNLIFLGVLLLSHFSKNKSFYMGNGINIIFLIVMMLNCSLLIYVTTEKKKLSNTTNKICWFSSGKIKIVFAIEGCILLLGVLLFVLSKPSAEYVIGIGIGMLAATVVLVLINKYVLKTTN